MTSYAALGMERKLKGGGMEAPWKAFLLLIDLRKLIGTDQ